MKEGQIGLERNNQTQLPQDSPSTKTKIATWWMLIIGGILGIPGLLTLIGIFAVPGFYSSGNDIVAAYQLTVAFIGTPFFIFYFLPGLFLLKRKIWSLKFAIVVLSIGIVMAIGNFIYQNFSLLSFFHSWRVFFLYYLIPLPLFLIPLVLLIFGKKEKH